LGAPRIDYQDPGLTEDRCPPAPLDLVRAWVDHAVARAVQGADVPEPTALALATVDEDGMPDVRTVLMRDLDHRGPAFFTGTDSAKGRQLAANTAAAAALTWPSLFRAIRFRGYAEPLPRAEVEAYFRSRPYGSRISAAASAQSHPVVDRATLEAAHARCAEQWPDTGSPDDVPVPQDWGGYRVVADRVELWAGRSNRLHDRLVYERTGPGGLADPAAWRLVRLQP
jgi:pyridoxamine 5'-phosphate oxidase